jgi:hypothetical protein
VGIELLRPVHPKNWMLVTFSVSKGKAVVWLACLLAAAVCCSTAAAQESVRGRASNPHGAIKQRCDECHTTTAWKPIRKEPEFDHDKQTSFPLLGLHHSVSCTSCHTNLVFSKAPTKCAECHADLHRRQFGPDCEKCHTVRGWTVAISAIQDHNNRFPLLGAHAVATCDQCHHGAAAGVYTGLSTDCVSCHLKDYQTATPLNHVTAKLPLTCEVCHTNVNVWTGAKFDHNRFTSFPLTGAHAALECAQCHINGVFNGTPVQCIGCHLADFNSATNPNHVTAKFPTTCDTCHNSVNWVTTTFDHTQFTSFPLTGAHVTVACAQCHLNGDFVGTPTQCVGCHLADFQKTTTPNHSTVGFSQDCATCHTTANWTSSTFNHATTGFALLGLHATQQCIACHINNNYAISSAACINCHQTDYNGALNPPHQSAGFPLDCTLCHGNAALNWTSAPTFDHSTTGFTLTGAHITVQCVQCHANNNYSLTSGACWNCHQTDFNNTTNPPHKAANFAQDCSVCHSTTDWTGATFNHASTGFELVGLHATQACIACHVNNNYNLTSALCWNCHQTDFNNATNPPHKGGAFPQDCVPCHGAAALSWTTGTFDHSSTGFALAGAHATQACAVCHVNGNYSIPDAACANCHLTDYNGATNPPHKSAGFPLDCTLCHGSSAINWTNSTFDHSTTGFPLTGSHVTLQCAQCHVNNNYNLTSTACWTCHQTDYNNTTSPPHKAAGMAQDCSTCHTTVNWDGATFNHTTTGFALVGLHSDQQCIACHVNNNYNLTSTACWSCHQTDYNNTTNPPHKSGAFPQDCVPCHGSSALSWTTGSFDHSTTGFALVGVHATQACAACHINNNYNITDAACANCHLTDYNGATNPPHKSAGFPLDCTLCHGSSAINWTSSTFDHSTTGFPLTGSHVTLQCVQCHVNNNYNLTSTACWTCHQTDYNSTANPPHKSANFSQDCSTCHTTVNWDGATFNHATTGFALVGLHSDQQCIACHVNNNYKLTSTACWSCHQTDYNNTTSPPHKSGAFPQDCVPCHGASALSWTTGSFDHSTTGFTLVGVHATQTCVACHINNNYNLTSTACINCHLNDYNGATNPPHKSAGFPQDCTLCHGSSALSWTTATFDHSTTGFPLTGSHVTLQCVQCHVNNNYTLSSAACWNCHQADYNATTNPPHKSANFAQDCSTCHGTVNWDGATFNHASTGFTLVGVHATSQCTACHLSGNYSLTSTACWSCHQTDYNGANNPPHKSAGFPQDCTLCHGSSVINWTSATFDHSTTGFALTGGHTTLQCAQCHVNGNYSLTSAACAQCHMTDYNNTTNPAHKAAAFPLTCDGCHTTAPGWGGATFNHASTGFALTNAHTTVACIQCHVNGNYTLASGACAQCHMTDYNNTTDPAHKAAAFPITCDGCHTTVAGWGGATFNHASTGFALTNAHTTLQCVQCHVNGNYSLTNGACAQCHMTDYNNTTNPAHKAAAFPTTCDSCHTTVAGWGGATFNHASTGFALTNAHTTLQCVQCHVSGNYSLTSGACAQCHMTDYNNTTNPAHKAAAFPVTCDGCHTTVAGWGGATFNHASTGFALTNAHTTLQCAQCHVSGNYSLTSGACAQCHMTDYNNTTNPAHAAAAFPTTCDSCHTTVAGWGGATFNHASTGFALTNAHTTLQCVQCHVSGNYSLTSGACAQCHMTDYNNTTNPAHKAAAFPTTCDSCHTTVAGWGGATFNHATTGFALTNAHTTLQCAQCHVSGNYSLTSGACAQCHMTDYNGTNNPPHQAAGFPTTCDTCHTTVAGWGGATFNHTTTGFALTNAHTTLTCVQCHVSNNYSLSSGACAQCHMTDYNNTTNPAHKAAAFPTTCDSCHTTVAGWGGATFNHATTGFALTGFHASMQCVQCHVSGNYSLTSGACWNCHQTDYNGTTNPPHLASGFPQDCSGCHTTTDWTGATFNHTTTGFALTGFHATMQCAQCHVNNNFSLNSSNTACYGCHQADYNGTTAPAHAAAGFPQDCSVCHSTTDWTGATFTHPTTPLALSGYHATMLANGQCALCHVGNNYTSTPSDCWSCHQTDYNGTTAPSHVASAFPQTCNTCHTFVDWTGATYTAHDTAYFPIYSGTHNGKWTACSDCHANSADYSVFSCIICHQHSSQTSVTNEHGGVKNFVYNGTSCYTCHPRGSGG